MAKVANAPEETQYFEGMEPPKVAAIDRAMAKLETAKNGLEAAKDELEACESALQSAMEKHAAELGRDAKGSLRYVCKKLNLVALLEENHKVKVKLKTAPVVVAGQ